MTDETTYGEAIVSVVVPCLNERESLAPLTDKVSGVLDDLIPASHSWELIFVDDGSNDGSREELVTLRESHDSVRVISFRRNFGKAAALKAGFEQARAPLVVSLDADLQDDPDEIPKLLAKLHEGYDVVSGWKVDRNDPWTKRVPSWFFNKTLDALSGVSLHDYNCGLKAYRGEAVDELHIYGELHRYIPVLLHYRGFRIAELPVNHLPRKFGRSKYGFERFTRGFLDLLTVLLLTRYASRPLHAFGGVGLVVTAVGFAVLAYLTVMKFAYGIALSNRPLLSLGILLMVVGVQFISTGLLGEMLARDQQEKLEPHVLSEEVESASDRALGVLADRLPGLEPDDTTQTTHSGEENDSAPDAETVSRAAS